MKSEQMATLASKLWDRGSGLEIARTATHTQLSTPPGANSALDSAAVHPDDLYTASTVGGLFMQ